MKKQSQSITLTIALDDPTREALDRQCTERGEQPGTTAYGQLLSELLIDFLRTHDRQYRERGEDDPEG
jgi:hypothetical protein